MNSSVGQRAIAITPSDCDRRLEQITAQAEEISIAPEELCSVPVDETAARIRQIKLGKVRVALVEGEYFTQARQRCKKLKDFKAWLDEQGFTWKDACKHIKLYETFCDLPLEQIGWVSLDTLFALLQPRYQELLK